MTNHYHKRIYKTIAGLSLSLAIAFTGSVILPPQSAQAAYSYDQGNRYNSYSGNYNYFRYNPYFNYYDYNNNSSSNTSTSTDKNTNTNTNSKAPVSSSLTLADKIIASGKKLIGTPYQFGAKAGSTDYFDCSSFAQYVYKLHGVELPRSSRQQALEGERVTKSQLQPGDLVFSDTNKDGVINHVSIYMGDGKLLHTYRKGIGVTISDFDGSTWDKTFVTARRVL
jgi:cell wall-associated NlpC family hydrolase